MKAAHKSLIAAFALAASACASAPLTLNDDVIVPGTRVGDVEIGMPLSQLLALKGTPNRTIPIPNSAATTYVYDGLSIAAHDEVYWIVVKDRRFRTSEGVGPGVEQIFARGALGQPDCVATRTSTTVYDYGDLYFDVDNSSGKVLELGVQAETKTCQS
ncbi:MAG: hypothetical protein AAGB25_01610 [Pseudomonadota bacterium]